MFKLFHFKNQKKEEVLPINDIYNVYELGDYEFQYDSADDLDLNSIDIFIEDYIVDKINIDIQGNTIKSKRNKYFQDYFGFAALKIDNQTFKLNILIEKFKLSEIEEILLFLWKSENKIFDNFFSKSTLKAKISNVGSDYGLTSKFLTFSEIFYNTFSKLYSNFNNLPHTLLRSKIDVVDFSHHKVTSHSIDWVINNIDSICFDQNFEGHPDCIIIEDNFGLIDKIETENKISSYSVYENEIILGAFKNLINQLKQLKKEIGYNLSYSTYVTDKSYADFRDLKKIPYLKLFKDSNNIEDKLTQLYNKYCGIFKNTKYRVERPRVTNIFANSPHYSMAYKIIKDSYDYKFNFNGELNLLNIKKLSQLYEVYNLHQILQAFKDKLIIDPYFKFETDSQRDDGIIDYISFKHDNFSIEIFYELKIPNENFTKLVRLDISNGSYYLPDYLINIKNGNELLYSALLDSKYSKHYSLKYNHLPSCISKYIVNLGFENERYRKIDDLMLIYPGEEIDSIQSNPLFAPRIILIPSKPKFEIFLKEYIGELIEKTIPSYAIKRKDYIMN